MSQFPYRGRIAPSPTGYMHLGHAKTFWTAFERCRQAGGTLIYREEDIDTQRCKDSFAHAAVVDLQQLGIDWDDGPIRQSERTALYAATLQQLISKGFAYPCHASRKMIKEHPETQISSEGESIFPQKLRPNDAVAPDSPVDLKVNWRFRVPDERKISFEDLNLGPHSFLSQIDFGDFLVWRRDGMPSYELAVVVDDLDMKITEVVRGADLLVSTARQLLLYEALDAEPPAFYHESLVLDESGKRLAKRKDSLALRTLFSQGHTRESIQSLWSARS